MLDVSILSWLSGWLLGRGMARGESGENKDHRIGIPMGCLWRRFADFCSEFQLDDMRFGFYYQSMTKLQLTLKSSHDQRYWHWHAKCYCTGLGTSSCRFIDISTDALDVVDRNSTAYFARPVRLHRILLEYLRGCNCLLVGFVSLL